jgi:hypothetical protein
MTRHVPDHLANRALRHPLVERHRLAVKPAAPAVPRGPSRPAGRAAASGPAWTAVAMRALDTAPESGSRSRLMTWRSGRDDHIAAPNRRMTVRRAFGVIGAARAPPSARICSPAACRRLAWSPPRGPVSPSAACRRDGPRPPPSIAMKDRPCPACASRTPTWYRGQGHAGNGKERACACSPRADRSAVTRSPCRLARHRWPVQRASAATASATATRSASSVEPA